MTEQPVNQDITSDDKLWAALGYPISPLAIIALFMEDKKSRPFIKFHAVQSIAVNLVLYIVMTVIVVITLGIGSICAPILWLAILWPAYVAFQGKYLELPVITDFLRKQNWV